MAAARRDGRRVCVVVSAMGKTTDELLALAKQVSESPARRELDMLLTAGERISMALLSMALEDLGVPGHQLHRQPGGHHHQRPARLGAHRRGAAGPGPGGARTRGRVVIVAGFQGVSPRKEITTLGRGGSDTTAVALAAALGADCEIYSDVDGVFTADPRVVPSPRRLDEISYEEMQELARAGAKVLNAQAVEFAREKGIAIHARATVGVDGGDGGARPRRGGEPGGRRDLAEGTWRWSRCPGAGSEPRSRRWSGGARSPPTSPPTGDGRWPWSRSTTRTSGRRRGANCSPPSPTRRWTTGTPGR